VADAEVLDDRGARSETPKGIWGVDTSSRYLSQWDMGPGEGPEICLANSMQQMLSLMHILSQCSTL